MTSPVQSHGHHLAHAQRLHPWRDLTAGLHSFNAQAAVIITDVLGSMPFYWATNILALLSLPATLTLVDSALKSVFPPWLVNVSLISLIAWISQTYIQLTALPVLQVSGNAQGAAQAANTRTILQDAEETRVHTERILDALRLDTEGGLADLRDDLAARIDRLEGKV